MCVRSYTEWSDGAPATARLVSLGIAPHEPDGTKTTGYWLVNPMTHISAEATEVHGIRDQDVADKPPFEDVAADVSLMLTGCDLGGYGIRGDVQVIELEMQRLGVRWSPTRAAIIDGLRMWQLLEPRRLEDAYKKFVGPLPKTSRTHHAAFDVELTTAVIAALQRKPHSREDPRPDQREHGRRRPPVPAGPGQADRVRLRPLPGSGRHRPP